MRRMLTMSLALSSALAGTANATIIVHPPTLPAPTVSCNDGETAIHAAGGLICAEYDANQSLVYAYSVDANHVVHEVSVTYPNGGVGYCIAAVISFSQGSQWYNVSEFLDENVTICWDPNNGDPVEEQVSWNAPGFGRYAYTLNNFDYPDAKASVFAAWLPAAGGSTPIASSQWNLYVEGDTNGFYPSTGVIYLLGAQVQQASYMNNALWGKHLVAFGGNELAVGRAAEQACSLFYTTSAGAVKDDLLTLCGMAGAVGTDLFLTYPSSFGWADEVPYGTGGYPSHMKPYDPKDLSICGGPVWQGC